MRDSLANPGLNLKEIILLQCALCTIHQGVLRRRKLGKRTTGRQPVTEAFLLIYHNGRKNKHLGKPRCKKGEGESHKHMEEKSQSLFAIEIPLAQRS